MPSGAFEESIPALAQTKPWWVSQITVPPRRRTIRALSERISSHRAGSLPVSWARARAGAPGRMPASSTIRPSALLTTFWATITTSPGTTPSAAARAESIPARSSPGSHLGQRRQRPEPQRALPAPARALARSKAVRVAQGTPEAIRARRSAGVSMSRAMPGSSRVSATRPAAPGAREVAGARVGAEGGAHRGRRAQQHRVGAGPVARGHQQHRARRAGGGERRLDLAGAREGQVGREDERRLGAGAGRLGEADLDRRVHPPGRIVVGDDPRALGGGAGAGLGIGGHHQDLDQAARRRAGAEHVRQHRRLQLAARAGVEHPRQAPQGHARGLHRHHHRRGRATAHPSAASVVAARRARAGRSGIRASVSTGRTPSAAIAGASASSRESSTKVAATSR